MLMPLDSVLDAPCLVLSWLGHHKKGDNVIQAFKFTLGKGILLFLGIKLHFLLIEIGFYGFFKYLFFVLTIIQIEVKFL